jgi:hypothetical protein
LVSSPKAAGSRTKLEPILPKFAKSKTVLPGKAKNFFEDEPKIKDEEKPPTPEEL